MVLAASKDVPEKDSALAFEHQMGVTAGGVIFTGSLVVTAADGFIDVGTSATGLTAAGISTGGRDADNDGTVDNTAGADGDLVCRFRSGIFKFANDAGTAVVQADIGRDCWIFDDETVTGDNTGASLAGKVYEIDDDGDIWVLISFPASNA